eukprot:1176384-Prorocentrum_minimum.AAC.2
MSVSGCYYQVGELSPPDCASIAWAFANAGLLDAALFRQLARMLPEGALDELDEEELANAEWAFVAAGQQAAVKAIQARRKRRQKGGSGGASGPEGPSADVIARCGLIVVRSNSMTDQPDTGSAGIFS